MNEDIPYFGNSSNDDNDEKSDKYTKTNIITTTHLLKADKRIRFICSFLLLEVGQSILEQIDVLKLYKEKKLKIASSTTMQLLLMQNIDNYFLKFRRDIVSIFISNSVVNTEVILNKQEEVLVKIFIEEKIKHINTEFNRKIHNALLNFRPITYYSNESENKGIELFPNFRLDHRILRGIIKEIEISNTKSESLCHSASLNGFRIFSDITITRNGCRVGYRQLPL